MKKIAVAGIGGVGGFLGGALAKTYDYVYFLSRGARLLGLKEQGITVESARLGTFTALPRAVSDHADELGIMDVIFICVKNYSLRELCEQLRPMVASHTIVVPVMNGTQAGARTREYLGTGIVLDALIYIVASGEGGVFRQSGEVCDLHVGYAPDREEEAGTVCTLLNGAGVPCAVERDIRTAIWRKYILNCAYNITTAYYNTGIGAMFENEERRGQVRALLSEACLVARTGRIPISDTLEEELMRQFEFELAPDSTSSLKRDMEAGRRNELEVFSGELLRLGKGLGLRLPVSEWFYGELNKQRPAAEAGPGGKGETA